MRFPTDSRLKTLAGDFFGAFSDSAILLPLVLILSQVPGFSLPFLLASAGITHLIAGALFRVPISVQPLKSIAIASVAAGASAYEIRAAAALLGAFFIILFFLKLKSIPLPEPLVRSVQSGLGVLLLLQAGALPSILIAFFILFLHYRFGVSTLGFFSLFLFLESLSFSGVSPTPHSPDLFRLPVVLSLLLPQIALTAANSISGASLALAHHHPKSSGKVTIPRLMASVGFGNLLAGFFSGLPFCHGAGGVTAHAKGGATTARMNAIIGGVLILSAWTLLSLGGSVRINPIYLSPVLACIGAFHLELGKPLWSSSHGRVLFVTSCLITLLTSNLLYCLVGSSLVFFMQLKLRRSTSHG